ncbi:hypothetical protein Ddc_17978 [Ditylenchus destructor]|nr:hypothetical protein Ddc_17978 [Ditylenchus destructor]
MRIRTTCNPFEDRFLSDQYVNLTDLEERLNSTINATEWIAIIFLIVKIIKTLVQGIECVVLFFSDKKAKEKKEKDEKSLKESSIKLSVKAKQPLTVGILPAANYVLVSRNKQKRKWGEEKKGTVIAPSSHRKVEKEESGEEEEAFRGTIVAIGSGFFIPSENKFKEHEFEISDLVFLKGNGTKVFDQLSNGWYWLYHVNDVVAAYLKN